MGAEEVEDSFCNPVCHQFYTHKKPGNLPTYSFAGYFPENGLTDGNGKSSNEEMPINKISSLYLANQ